jgi:hypothetical protein
VAEPPRGWLRLLSRWLGSSRTATQIGRDEGELIQGRLQVLDDLGRDDLGRGQIVGVLQALVAKPEDVQAGLVPLDQVLVVERVESVGLCALLPILRVEALREVLQVGTHQRLGAQREVHVGPEVIDPELGGRGASLPARRSKKSTFDLTPCA